jgi:hypothetical protein
MPDLTPDAFRHKIGDALYDLFTDADGQIPDRVLMYPVIKITARCVFVNGPWFYDRDRTYRFSRTGLETKGRAWNQQNRLGLHVRPLPSWPLLVVDVRTPEQLAIAGPPVSKENDDAH